MLLIWVAWIYNDIWALFKQATASEMSERALEEERMLSVLEYVWKLEEELHQQVGRQPAATPTPTTGGRSKSVGVSRSKTQSPVERTMSSEEIARNVAATMMCAITDNLSIVAKTL